MPLAIQSYQERNLADLWVSHPAWEVISRVIPKATDRITNADLINFVFYDKGGESGHKCFYDEDYVFHSLNFCGFSKVERSGYSEKTDLAVHKDFSIYFEATR